jgi:DNA uptake protein ComE-like DNA-binding protein
MFRYYFRRIITEMKINKNQWLGVFSLLILLVSIQFIFSPFSKNNNKPIVISSENDVAKIDKNPILGSKPNAFTAFDPNQLTQKEWQNLGFSEKQAISILKYKNYLGGQFTSKEQIKKCFVISEQKFNELLPYIKDIKIKKTSDWHKTPIPDKQEKPKIKSFNPNTLDSKGWQNLGFSEKQANAILRYKNSLGGQFTSKNQIKKCFVISETKFADLEPYIQIKETAAAIISPKIEEKSNSSTPKIQKHTPFDPNQLEQNDWQNLGFSEKQAISILKYKKHLGGQFTSKEQIKKCFVISPDKFIELEPYLLIQ